MSENSYHTKKSAVIVVDGKLYQIHGAITKMNSSLIECLELSGSDIPNFCYNKYLSIAGNCRMCVIESLNAIKPLVSCVANTKSYLSSKIFTGSPLTSKSKENVLDTLLINHPMDCAACDQGGKCDLQDHSATAGLSDKRFYNYKRGVEDKIIDNLIKTSMTRCIHCSRCIRFSFEFVGLKQLGLFRRGVFSEVGLYNLIKRLASELSGNLIDLCPVARVQLRKRRGRGLRSPLEKLLLLKAAFVAVVVFYLLGVDWELSNALLSYTSVVQDTSILSPSVELPGAPIESYCTQAESFHEGNRVLEEKKRWEEFGASSDAPTFDDYFAAEKQVVPSMLYMYTTGAVILAAALATPTALATVSTVTLMMCINMTFLPFEA